MLDTHCPLGVHTCTLTHFPRFPGTPSSPPQAVEEALTRILTPKRSIDVLREVQAAQVRAAALGPAAAPRCVLCGAAQAPSSGIWCPLPLVVGQQPGGRTHVARVPANTEWKGTANYGSGSGAGQCHPRGAWLRCAGGGLAPPTRGPAQAPTLPLRPPTHPHLPSSPAPLCPSPQAKGRPYIITFVGVNGVGKSTNLAKVRPGGKEPVQLQLLCAPAGRGGPHGLQAARPLSPLPGLPLELIS